MVSSPVIGFLQITDINRFISPVALKKRFSFYCNGITEKLK